MSLTMELSNDIGSGQLTFAYDSFNERFKISLSDDDQSIIVDNATLDQVEEMLFKARKVLLLARYEEAAEKLKRGEYDDESEDE